MEVILQQLADGDKVELNQVASVLQAQFIGIIYTVDNQCIYAANSLEELRQVFIYPKMELVFRGCDSWILKKKYTDTDYRIMINPDRTEKLYTFFREDAVNIILH